MPPVGGNFCRDVGLRWAQILCPIYLTIDHHPAGKSRRERGHQLFRGEHPGADCGLDGDLGDLEQCGHLG